MRRRVLILLAVLLLGMAWGGFAHAQVPLLTWRTTPEQPTVGDRIHADLVLTHPDHTLPDWEGVAPAFAGAEADPEVTESSTLASAAGGGLTSVRGYILYADLPGTVTLPKVTAVVTTPDGGRVPVTANGVNLLVAGVFDATNPPELAAAKGPLTVPVSPGPYIAALLLAVVVLAALAWWWSRRRRPEISPEPLPVAVEPVIPPHQKALARLDALDPTMPAREFFGELSDIVRDYLAGRYGIPAPRMTSSEVAKMGTSRTEVQTAADWLGAWDLFKFARLHPREGEAGASLALVRSWVIESAGERHGEAS